MAASLLDWNKLGFEGLEMMCGLPVLVRSSDEETQKWLICCVPTTDGCNVHPVRACRVTK